MAEYLSRLRPIGLLLLVACVGLVPSILWSLKPDVYWVQLWVPNVNRYLEPAVAVMLVLLPIAYLIYRLRRPMVPTQELSERKSTIFFILNAAQIVVAFLLLPYLCYLVLYWIFGSSAAGPYHLDRLTYNNHQYNVMLAPYWNGADIVVYECNAQGEQCLKHAVRDLRDSADNFWDAAQYGASLGVEDDKLYLCLRDRRSIELQRDVLGNTHLWEAGNDEPLCKGKAMSEKRFGPNGDILDSWSLESSTSNIY